MTLTDVVNAIIDTLEKAGLDCEGEDEGKYEYGIDFRDIKTGGRFEVRIEAV